jgi:proteinaceous RNase P
VQVSHDLMRDHVWSMLRPKHMLKWKARHTIDYTFSFDKRQFFPQEPLPYTPCVQELRPGVWLLPTVSESDTCPWLLCQPAPVEA